jgi:hypothetical protein
MRPARLSGERDGGFQMVRAERDDFDLTCLHGGVLHVVPASLPERRRADRLKAMVQAVSYGFAIIGRRILC